MTTHIAARSPRSGTPRKVFVSEDLMSRTVRIEVLTQSGHVSEMINMPPDEAQRMATRLQEAANEIRQLEGRS